MGVQNLLKRVCLEASPIPVTSILRDGKMIRSMGLITLQIRKTVRPVMEVIFEGGPRVYRAMLAITAGAAPMRKPLMKILIVAKPAMEPQLQPAQIAIIAVGAAPTAKNMPQILTTVRPVMERI